MGYIQAFDLKSSDVRKGILYLIHHNSLLFPGPLLFLLIEEIIGTTFLKMSLVGPILLAMIFLKQISE